MAAGQTDYYVLWNTNEGDRYYKAQKERETSKYIYVKYDDESEGRFDKKIVNKSKNNEGLIKVISSDVWDGAYDLMFIMNSSPPPNGNQVAAQPQEGSGRKRKKKKSRKKRGGRKLNLFLSEINNRLRDVEERGEEREDEIRSNSAEIRNNDAAIIGNGDEITENAVDIGVIRSYINYKLNIQNE